MTIFLLGTNVIEFASAGVRKDRRDRKRKRGKDESER